MCRKKWKYGISLMLAAALAFGSAAGSVPVSVQAQSKEAAGTIYYIDAQGGSDSSDGKSEQTAWKTFKNLPALQLGAGDQVLLKAGCAWNGEKLMIKNARGSAQNPVVLGRYGEGKDPLINGNGNAWMTDRSNLKKEDVAVVHVQDSEHITIQNLEVTNWESDTADLMGETNERVKYDQSKYLLTGILVENHDAGGLEGITIKDNFVHEVNGYMLPGAEKGTGGIMALVTGGNVKSYFKDLRITGNKVENVCHEAIYMESCWAARTLVGGANSQQAGKQEWVGWPDVYVAHNYVNAVAGDGIVLINCDGGVAEYNLVTKSASEEWDYSRNAGHAAIWMWDCNNVTMQYNEAAYTETPSQDGMAFDCDYGNQNVMYQYNYSHNNKGGFWMACPGPYYVVNAVVRYNVSVNDGLADNTRIIRLGEQGAIGNQFYNNTIYWDTGYKVKAVEQGTWGKAPSGGTEIYNNIFCGDSGEFVNNNGVRYDSNCVWGSVKDVYPLDEDTNAVVADPGFVNVGDVTEGSFENHKVALGTANGLKLRQDSPCINAGRSLMAVPEEQPNAVKNELVKTQITLENKDYEGNAVPYASQDIKNRQVDIGAFEYQGDGVLPQTDKSYLEALTGIAAGYVQANYTESSWKALQNALRDARALLENSRAAQTAVDAMAGRLESAFLGMERVGASKPGTAADDILASYNSSSEIDNSGFEKAGSNWGKWQSTVSVSSEHAHTGSKSLKVEKTGNDTGYSELGDIPVKKNTAYILEAWVYCDGNNDYTKVGLEAKHHSKVTQNGDIKLGIMNVAADSQADAKGWHKAAMEFTTQGYERVSVSLSTDTKLAYMDDVVLYPKATVSLLPGPDRTEIEDALKLSPAEEQAYYTVDSWKRYQDAVLSAKLARVNAAATAESLKQAAENLRNAYLALEKAKEADKGVLQSLYDSYKDKKQEEYTDASWHTFQAALATAGQILEKTGAVQEEIDQAKEDLQEAYSKLEKKAPVAADKAALQSMYHSCAGKKKENYTAASWKKFQSAQESAKAILEKEDASQEEADQAAAALKAARDSLKTKSSQAIRYTKAYRKAYGAKAFQMDAKVFKGKGALRYKTSDKKVATVSPKGKVTIKGTGICTITITAEATDNYKAKTVKATIKAEPKKASLVSVNTIKGRKMAIKWKKDKKATGYEIQYSFKKNFKNAKSLPVKKSSATSATVKKLSKGKAYYVRIRSFKAVKVNGKNVKLNGSWSKTRRSTKIKY